MSNKKSNPNSGNRGALMALLLVGAMGATALTTYITMGPGKSIPKEEQRAERLPEHQEGKTDSTAGKMDLKDPVETQVTILSPKSDDKGNITYDKRTETVPQGENRYLLAINSFLEEAKISPEGSKAVAADLEPDGLLTLQFNEAFDTTYGTEDEEILVDGILKSVGQFRAVKRVRFTIMGRPMETLGNIDLTQPMPALRD